MDTFDFFSHQFILNEGSKKFEVRSLQNRNDRNSLGEIVKSYYIGPDEDQIKIRFVGEKVEISRTSQLENVAIYPLSEYDFALKRDGGILIIDIRDIAKASNHQVHNVQNGVENSYLCMRIDAEGNLILSTPTNPN